MAPFIISDLVRKPAIVAKASRQSYTYPEEIVIESPILRSLSYLSILEYNSSRNERLSKFLEGISEVLIPMNASLVAQGGSLPREDVNVQGTGESMKGHKAFDERPENIERYFMDYYLLRVPLWGDLDVPDPVL